MVKLIAKAHGKDIKIVPGLRQGIKFAGQFTELVSKAFGSLTYDKNMSGHINSYCKVTLGQSVARTENKMGKNNSILFLEKMTKKKITISIVTYNNADEIRTLMSSLMKSSCFNDIECLCG